MSRSSGRRSPLTKARAAASSSRTEANAGEPANITVASCAALATKELILAVGIAAVSLKRTRTQLRERR
jgi:hypothetical protein